MYSVYSYADLSYHDSFSLIKSGFSDYSTAEEFLKELQEKNLSSEYFDELVVCKTLTTHKNEEPNIHFDAQWMKEAYAVIITKYFG